jgi:hypothetical protein
MSRRLRTPQKRNPVGKAVIVEKYFLASYAPAWAGLADSWLLLGETHLRPREEAFPEARRSVDEALRLDDELG